MVFKRTIVLLLIAAIAMSMAGCAVSAKATNLMDKISPNNVNGKAADDSFAASMADFSIKLFKKSITDKENSLISPLSVVLALAMTANGAGGETLRQMETILGGDMSLDELNEYLHNYVTGLPDTNKLKLKTANSIWFRDEKDRLQVNADFLQRNADYYGAAAYKSAFDAKTLKDMNDWVKSNTDGMIERIVDDIDKDAMLYLINAVSFDAEWKDIYMETAVHEGIFTNIRMEAQTVDFMHSQESRYLDDGKATGFIRPYVGRYSFAALLPNEDVSIEAYIDLLTGEGLLDTLANARGDKVIVSIPKFGYEYDVKMNDALKALGMTDAFDVYMADFSKIGTSPEGPLYISAVLHKTFIAVDERGTRAGAATAVVVTPGAAPQQEMPKIVHLDRPFVYAIIDDATNLPVFIGTVMSV